MPTAPKTRGNLSNENKSGEAQLPRLDHLPKALQPAVKKYLEENSHDQEQAQLLDRLFSDKRSSPLWKQFLHLPSRKRSNHLFFFLLMCSDLLSEARKNVIPPKVRDRHRALRKNLRTPIITLQSIVDELHRSGALLDRSSASLKRRINHIDHVLSATLDLSRSDQTEWLVALQGTEFNEVGTFKKRGSKNSVDIYITNALVTSFKKYFDDRLPALAHNISQVIQGINVSSVESREKSRQRVRGRYRAKIKTKK